MSIWDRFGRGMKWTYLEPDLTGQGIVGVWPAGERKGPISMSGGRLVLTEQALIFCPMDLSEAKEVVDLVFTAGQIPGGDLVGKLASLGRDSVLAIPLANIASVEQTSAARLLSPPSIRIATKWAAPMTLGFWQESGIRTSAPRTTKRSPTFCQSCNPGSLPADQSRPLRRDRRHRPPDRPSAAWRVASISDGDCARGPEDLSACRSLT